MALTRPNASQVNFDSTNITDPLIKLNSGQSGSNTKDLGLVLDRGSDTNVAIIWDESENQFAFVNTAEDGSTSGNVTISSYANIKANAFYGDGSNLTGVTSYGDSDVAAYLSANGYGTSSSIIASITDSAPGTLDTLNELAAALGDDANFSTTVTNSIATKLPLAGGTMTGSITFVGGQTFDGRDVSADGAKLDSIESGATGDQTASEILTAIKTVDGSGSGLDADTLDGLEATSFLRSDANDTASGQLYFSNTYNRFNTGNSNNTSTADTNGLYLHTSSYTDGRYTTRFRKYDNGGGVPLYIDNSSGTANTFTATARFGTYSGNGYEFEVFGDIKANGNVDATGVFNGTATSAQYADLAENYLADQAYPIGTVLEIGGDAEVTVAAQDSYKVVGTISEAPGYLMNSGLEGEHVVPVAYIGRVPCRVQGTIDRGDFLVVGNTPGVAVAKHPRDILTGQAIGKALESYNSDNEGVIEILVGRL